MEIASFNTDVERRVWMNLIWLLPCLFDSSTGIHAWIPVSYLGTVVVVVCIPMLQWIVENVPMGMYSCMKNEMNIRKMLELQFERHGGVVDVDKSKNDFRDIILQTPFRAKGGEFFVATAATWKRFIAAVSMKEGCQERFKCNVGQEISLRRFGEVYSVKKGKTKLGWFNGYTVNEKKKSTIPAWGVPMWEELFTSPIKEYFEMDKVEHVRGSQARVGGKPLRKYSDVV